MKRYTTMSTQRTNTSELGKSAKLCPKCGRRGSFHLKSFLSKGGHVYSYWYTAHYEAKKERGGVKWCYIGKNLPKANVNQSESSIENYVQSINRSTLLYLKDAAQRHETPVSHLG